MALKFLSVGRIFRRLSPPLLRGATINPKATGETKAFLFENQAEYLLRQTELALLPDALNHYWRWVGARDKRDVETGLLEVAKFRAKAVRQKIDKGLLPQIDGIEAEREAQRRLGWLYKAERALQLITDEQAG